MVSDATMRLNESFNYFFVIAKNTLETDRYYMIDLMY
jgi:hypothetical protein